MDTEMKKRLAGRSSLLIGGFGYIGCSLTERLLNEGSYVGVVESERGVKKVEKGPYAHLLDQVDLFVSDGRDICQYQEALDRSEIHINLLGCRHPESFPHTTGHILNTGIVQDLVEYAVERKRAKELPKSLLLQLGTQLIYGHPLQPLVTEIDPASPLGAYAEQKLEAERIVMHASKAENIQTLCYRISNVYGPGPMKKDGNLGQVIIQQLLESKEVLLYGKGLPTKDFIYINDLLEAIVQTIIHPPTYGEMFNIGSGTGYRLDDAVQRMQRVIGSGRVRIDPEKRGNAHHIILDHGKITRATGWVPQTSLEQGVKMTADWMRGLQTENHPPWRMAQ